MRKFVLVSLLALCLQLNGAAADEEKEDVGTVIGIDLGTTYSWYVSLKYQYNMLLSCYILFITAVLVCMKMAVWIS